MCLFKDTLIVQNKFQEKNAANRKKPLPYFDAQVKSESRILPKHHHRVKQKKICK